MSPPPRFAFSAVLSGHSSDVRCLASLAPSASVASAASLVSGSRDLTAKVWRTKPETKDVEWAEERAFAAHDRYVTAMATAAPSDSFPEGLVYTGTVGGVIRVFSPASSSALHEERGAHAACVSALFVSPSTGTLLSGSWDTTAKVWVGDRMKAVLTLEGHENSVWAVGILPETGIMITASADTSIRLWMAGACKTVLKGAHKQVREREGEREGEKERERKSNVFLASSHAFLLQGHS